MAGKPEGHGCAHSKKEAERQAARMALEALRQRAADGSQDGSTEDAAGAGAAAQSKKIRDNDKMTIDCFFIGSFDIVVRNPVFVLELFRKLPKEFVLHIVGRGMEDILEKYKCELGERLILHGMVSRWDAHAYMKNADVLVNVNNAVTNQLPSKLFEYINTGNPILNICKIKNCPSLEYMERYPLAYTLFEEDGINDSVVGKVKSFIRESYDKTVPKQEVLENYYDCTDGYVANLICENIEKTHK